MGQSTRIRLYGKPDCEMCSKAKDKLTKMNLRFQFIDVSKWLEYSDDWRDRLDETVEFHAAYAFYYPMPLPLFRFDNGEYLGYADGLAAAKRLYNAVNAAGAKKSVPVVETENVLEAVA